MNEITYNGHKYRVDEDRIYRDGVLLDIKIPKPINHIEKIEALMVDDIIFYKDNWYKKA